MPIIGCSTSTKDKTPRTILSAWQAIEIYQLKAMRHSNSDLEPSASTVGLWYGVSEKAVRDIWNARTWYRETLHLDPNRVDSDERLQRRLGRPRRTTPCQVRSKRQEDASGKRGSLLYATVKASPTSVADCWQMTNVPFSESASFNAGKIYLLEPSNASLCGQQAHEASSDFFPYSNLCWDDPFHDDWKHW